MLTRSQSPNRRQCFCLRNRQLCFFHHRFGADPAIADRHVSRKAKPKRVRETKYVVPNDCHQTCRLFVFDQRSGMGFMVDTSADVSVLSKNKQINTHLRTLIFMSPTIGPLKFTDNESWPWTSAYDHLHVEVLYRRSKRANNQRWS